MCFIHPLTRTHTHTHGALTHTHMVHTHTRYTYTLTHGAHTSTVVLLHHRHCEQALTKLCLCCQIVCKAVASCSMAILWYLSRINEDNPEKVSLDQRQVGFKKSCFYHGSVTLEGGLREGRGGCTEKFGNGVISLKF